MISPPHALAELGYRVFPCADKKPLTKHGFKEATSDPAQIDAWLAKWPHANWAIETTGLLIVDCDPGSETWPPNEDHALDLAAAPTVRTPRGGRHYYFRQPDGANLGNSVSFLAPHVDTRGSGGYVIAPPSANDGKAYSWVDGSIEKGPSDLPLPPQWLLALLSDKPAKAVAVSTEGEATRKIPAGQRNDALFRFACKMRGAGHTPAEIYGALSARNGERCDPPLPEDEVRRIAKSSGTYAPGKDYTGGSDTASRSISVRVSDVERKPVKWLWRNRIPAGVCV